MIVHDCMTHYIVIVQNLVFCELKKMLPAEYAFDFPSFFYVPSAAKRSHMYITVTLCDSHVYYYHLLSVLPQDLVFHHHTGDTL